MKTIGLLGGMSWESTSLYYRWINEETRRRRGGLHSAPMMIASVDFARIERLQHQNQWEEAGRLLAEEAKRLEHAGADFLVIATNTMHQVAPIIQSGTELPLLHIADATADVMEADGIRRVGLLGTRFTMEKRFYIERLEDRGFEVWVPQPAERDRVHSVIYEELCQGVIREESRTAYRDVMAGLAKRGAEAIILGCTEITLLIGEEDSPLPLYDTTHIHALRAVDWAAG
ncbi:aspartate/glutamate racemase family protein [Desmospora profundinema]|uniref:Aspartate racemase n=1 Tax=Desmospora profundinema TaxID=1571184 RepID=A0ABU1IMU3_9BACL|nr:aspartate/glutamate racemase family protein [Desmospora profundinema]MDR6226097.1 aspartate racemase [Desmospora profundinema]